MSWSPPRRPCTRRADGLGSRRCWSRPAATRSRWKNGGNREGSCGTAARRSSATSTTRGESRSSTSTAPATGTRRPWLVTRRRSRCCGPDATMILVVTGEIHPRTQAALDLAGTQVFGTEPGRIPAVLFEAYDASDTDLDRARLGAALARCWAYARESHRGVPFA